MSIYHHPPTHHYHTEIHKCRKSVAYFLHTYGHLFDATARAWVPFHLWSAQQHVLQTISTCRLTIILKARQLGLTWLVLGYALWLMLFQPAATVLIFSRRDEEAIDLLKVRLRGFYDRLPAWFKVRHFVTDNDHVWHWSNGSRVLAFPTTGGDSYSATLVIVDEADLIPDLAKLMSSVKPTIDGGGRMILVSRVDKSKPQSPFQRLYRAACHHHTEWKAVFLPWSARPDRDAAWYEVQRQDILHRTGALDDLYEQYPATDAQALLPPTLNKRIAPPWLEQCFQERPPLSDLPTGAPALPGLEVYALPEPGHKYVIGADPAEGNPTSDASALTVLDRATGEEVAALAGQLQPATLAAHLDVVGRWYNDAAVLVERNNHGHSVLLWLRDHSQLVRLWGEDRREGWLSSSKGKAWLYDAAADAFRERRTILHSRATLTQLARIEGATLRAPTGEADDRADAYALACVACHIRVYEPYDGPLVLWPPVRLPSDEPAGPRTHLQQIYYELGIDPYADDDEPAQPAWWEQ